MYTAIVTIIILFIIILRLHFNSLPKDNYIKDIQTNIELKSQTIGELANQNQELLAKVQELDINNKQLMERLQKEIENNQRILSQKKSGEVRLGQIGEQLIPFLEEFPYSSDNLHFLGMPVDYLHFDFDQARITFIEIKTGDATLSKRQKIIKNIIKSGRVFWDEVKITTKGIKVKGNPDDRSME